MMEKQINLALKKQVNLTFVFPNKDSIQCVANVGQTLYQVAISQEIPINPDYPVSYVRQYIQMSEKYPQTCLVQIQAGSSSSTDSFTELLLAPPTNNELNSLSSFQIKDGFRFADTYIVDTSLNNALIFLNLIRVYYFDAQSKCTRLQAYNGESMMSLRERSQSVVDLGFSCHGALSCSTCHCVVDIKGDSKDNLFKSLGEITEDEEDLLQFCNPQTHSRLGCQIAQIPNSLDDVLVFRNPKGKVRV